LGCGACAIATESRISVRVNQFGFFQVDLTHASPNDLRAGSLVCPFADESVDEDRLAAEFIPGMFPHDRRIGKYLSVSAGRIASDDIMQSSSGGLTSWMTKLLLERGLRIVIANASKFQRLDAPSRVA
jgi:coenzyme F420-reducing hydrogenase beta subunit